MAAQQDIAPPTPGDVLKRHLRKPGSRITQDVLADALGVSRFTVNQIINGRRAVTPDMALRLSYVLGTSAEMWIRLQNAVDLHQARRRLSGRLADLTILRQPRTHPPASI